MNEEISKLSKKDINILVEYIVETDIGTLDGLNTFLKLEEMKRNCIID